MKSCRCSKGTAFTLLEVVVGLTLMASVLVASLLAFSAHQQQRRRAEAKLAAVATADELLNQFISSREGIPANGRGTVPGKPDWIWRTRLIGTVNPAQVPLKVIRFEILEQRNRASLHPLLSVEVVEPIET